MSMKLREYKLGEIADLSYGKLPTKNIKADTGYPIYTGYRVSGYATKYLFEPPMLLVVARGVGGTGDVKISPPKSWITNLSIILNLNETIANKYYLKNLLSMSSLKDKLDSGSAQSQITINSLSSYKVLLPPLPIQTKIANILSAYDELIENNLKRIKLLEEMSKIKYEEWFVNRKIDGELVTDDKIRYVLLQEIVTDYMNGGWGKEEVEASYTEQAFVIRGTDIPDIKSGNFTSIPLRYHTLSNLKSRVLKHGDILMEMSNGNMSNVGRSLYFDEGIQSILKISVMCASFCKMFRPKNIGLSYLIDAHINYIHSNNQMNIYKSQAANGINNFQFENMIAEETINIPTDSAKQYKLFSNFEIIYKTISLLRSEIARLKEARDILLPRLMTGMIDVDSLMKDAA